MILYLLNIVILKQTKIFLIQTQFEKLFIENKLKQLDFSNKKYQRYYFILSFKYNNNIDAPTIIEKYKTILNIPITLTSKEISKIKNKIIIPLNTLNLEELYKNIKSNSFEIIVKSTDTKYEYINNKDLHNNKEQR